MATYVLVHGAGTGGWLWTDVAQKLHAAGHTAITPSLVGVGEALEETEPDVDLSRHVDQLVELFESGGLTDVVLVGFSYGGFVITSAAARLRDRLSRLVFVDAFMPRPGMSFLDLLPAPAREAMVGAADAHGAGRSVPPAPLQMVGGIGALEPGVERDHVLEVLQGRGFHPLASYREVVPDTASEPVDVPRTFVSCTDKPAGDPLLALASSLRSAGWDVRDLPTGHFAMLSMPTALVGLLLEEPTTESGMLPT